jgi:hypothetical protein
LCSASCAMAACRLRALRRPPPYLVASVRSRSPHPTTPARPRRPPHLAAPARPRCPSHPLVSTRPDEIQAAAADTGGGGGIQALHDGAH